MLQFYKMMNCSGYFLGPSIKSYNKDFIEIVWYRPDFSNTEMAQHFLKEAPPFRANDPILCHLLRKGRRKFLPNVKTRRYREREQG